LCCSPAPPWQLEELQLAAPKYRGELIWLSNRTAASVPAIASSATMANTGISQRRAELATVRNYYATPLLKASGNID